MASEGRLDHLAGGVVVVDHQDADFFGATELVGRGAPRLFSHVSAVAVVRGYKGGGTGFFDVDGHAWFPPMESALAGASLGGDFVFSAAGR